MSQYLPFDVPVPPIPSTDEGDFCVTFDRKYLPYVVGALQALLDSSTYESDVDSSVAMAHDLIATIQTGECVTALPIGTIINYATTNVPANCLNCDGTQYLRTAYPALYAVLHSQYIVDADYFRVPDFRGRAPIGIGAGAGLTARTMNTDVGEETHQLSAGELASHNHDIKLRLAGNTTGASVNVWSPTGTTQGATSELTGSGTAHNNMQPSRAIGFCIVAQ